MAIPSELCGVRLPALLLHPNPATLSAASSDVGRNAEWGGVRWLRRATRRKISFELARGKFIEGFCRGRAAAKVSKLDILKSQALGAAFDWCSTGSSLGPSISGSVDLPKSLMDPHVSPKTQMFLGLLSSTHSRPPAGVTMTMTFCGSFPSKPSTNDALEPTEASPKADLTSSHLPDEEGDKGQPRACRQHVSRTIGERRCLPFFMT